MKFSTLLIAVLPLCPVIRAILPLKIINKIKTDKCFISTLDININNNEVAPNIKAVDKLVRAINKQITPIHTKGTISVLILSSYY